MSVNRSSLFEFISWLSILSINTNAGSGLNSYLIKFNVIYITYKYEYSV